MEPLDHTHMEPMDRELAALLTTTEGIDMRTTALTGSGSTNANADTGSDCGPECATRRPAVVKQLTAAPGVVT